MNALDQIHARLMVGYENWAEPHRERISRRARADAEELFGAVAQELGEKLCRRAIRLSRLGERAQANAWMEARAVVVGDIEVPADPEAPAQQPRTSAWDGALLVSAVRLAASFGWRTISVRRLLRLMEGDRRYLPKGRR